MTEEDIEVWLREMKTHVTELESEVRVLRTALVQAEAERDLFFRHKQESGKLYSFARDKLIEIRGVLAAGGTAQAKIEALQALTSGETARAAATNNVTLMKEASDA